MQVLGGEGIAARDVREANEGVHERELTRVIELEPWDPFAVCESGGCGELTKLAAVHKRFENVLLDRQVPVGHGAESLAQRRQMVDSFGDSVVGDVVGDGFCPPGADGLARIA